MTPRTPLLAGILLLATVPAHPQGLTLDAYLSRTGEVNIRRSDTNATVAAVHPGIFEATWQMRSVAPVKSAPEGELQGVIRTAGGKGAVQVRGEVAAERKGLRLRYTMVPDTPITVNSIHVSVDLPVAGWVGATITSAGQPRGIVPEAAKPVQLATGVSSLTLENGARHLTVESQGSPVMLQDNRVFGASSLEIRVGPQDGAGRTWPAGKTETIAFTLDLGARINLQTERPITLSAGADWIPLEWKQDIVKGSALDLSGLNDAPAGKHGRVVAGPDGHFHFEQAKAPVRFYGGNLCFTANYLEKGEADRLADRLARLGYNAVRIHHYEGDLVDPKAPDSVTFRPDNLDRLDYLVAALKKRGIYITTDLFVSRPIRPQEGPAYDDYKMALLVSEPALRNWETFSGKLLRHVNPYTGLAWKDDPVIAWISVVNEPNAVGFLGRLQG